MLLPHHVIFALLVVKGHAVLHPPTAAALDKDAQGVRFGHPFLGHNPAQLFGCSRGHRHHRSTSPLSNFYKSNCITSKPSTGRVRRYAVACTGYPPIWFMIRLLANCPSASPCPQGL